MATVGEKRVRETRKEKITLKDAKSYWQYLEMETRGPKMTDL